MWNLPLWLLRETRAETVSAGAGQPPETRPRGKQRLNSSSAQTRRGNEAIILSELLLVRLPSRFHFLLFFKHKDKCSDAKLLQESSGEVAAPSSPPTWGPGASQRPSSRPHRSRLGPQPLPMTQWELALHPLRAPPRRTLRLSHAILIAQQEGAGEREGAGTAGPASPPQDALLDNGALQRHTLHMDPASSPNRFPVLSHRGLRLHN